MVDVVYLRYSVNIIYTYYKYIYLNSSDIKTPCFYGELCFKILNAGLCFVYLCAINEV